MKKSKLCIIAIVLVFALAACGGTQGANNPNGGTFAVDEIQNRPANYVGAITLVGIVGNSTTRDFALQNQAGTFEILVDYRGSQALPTIGSTIRITGRILNNCCGDGVKIRSTRYEVVE